MRFRGEIAEGAERERVKANLAEMFKASPAQIERLFSGKPVTVKKGLDEATARKYQAALKRAGAVAEIVRGLGEQGREPEAHASPGAPSPGSRPPADGTGERARFGPRETAETGGEGTQRQPEEPPAPARHSEPVSEPDTGGDPGLAPVGATIGEERAAKPPAIDTSSLQMGEPGETIVEAEETPTPSIDTSALSAAEPGETIIEAERPPPPEVDLSGLSVSEPGETIDSPDTPPPPQVDLSGMRLAEPGAQIDEPEKVPPPDVDISHLDTEQ